MLNQALYLKRMVSLYLFKFFAWLSLLFGMFWLIWILATLVQQGLPSLHLSTFIEMTQPPGSNGGLLNAVVGSLLITSIAILLGTPIGIFIGIYLSEFNRYGRLSSIIRNINDILLSAPSIIIGLFVYQIYVVRVGHFSGWAGCFALAILVIPVVVRTTEDMLLLIPYTLRESVVALGAPQWKVMVFILFRIARTGILTGILLAFARISGETAPLLFTVLNNQFWSLNLNQPLPNLPSVIFQYAMSPYTDWQQLGWTGALLITLWILSINIIVRVVYKQKPPLH